MLGKTSLYLVEPGTKIDSAYYCDDLLSQMIPAMSAVAAGDFIFQQDGARSHTSKHTLAYLEEHLPATSQLLTPDFWPPNSPDLNPMDYSIWSLLEQAVFKVKIRDVDHLAERLGEGWANVDQDVINEAIKSFRKRVKACIDAEGKRFEYKL